MTRQPYTLRSRILDRIGRSVFFAPEEYRLSSDFFWSPGERDQDLNHLREQVVLNVYNEMFRQNLRASLARWCLPVGLVLVLASSLLLSSSIAPHLAL